MAQDVTTPWTAPASEPAPLVPGDPRTIGPFRIRGRIASGGMGSVYLGTGRRGQRVAVKLVRGEHLDDAEFRARFKREVRAAAGLRSRYFAKLVDADPEAAHPWLATEYVPGPTLTQAVSSHGPLPRDVVLTVVAGVAEALREIHAAGLVHRDVKPSNVILGPDGPVLIDLGVVALAGATRVTMTGQAIGTPIYMAPEQAMGGTTTPAADVWALSALAYHAATGGYLFSGEHPAVVLYRVSSENPAYDDCPAYLRPLLDACLVRDPAHRPSIERILQVPGLREATAGGSWPGTTAGASTGARPGEQPGERSSERRPGERPGRRPSRIAVTGDGAPRAARRHRSRRLLVGGVVAAALLSATGFGILQSSGTGDDAAGGASSSASTPDGGKKAGPSGRSAAPGSEGSPQPSASALPPGLGRFERLPLGTETKLDPQSCWHARLDAVEGRQVRFTIWCDKAGTELYQDTLPSRWLRPWAYDANGTSLGPANTTDTFYTQPHLTDPGQRAEVEVTFLDSGADLAAVGLIQTTKGYTKAWEARP
ncbi:serine/threonine-protein kinase [Myceligenerans crystallogenes]|uniref:Serine/threonine-protein kinase n=1 Tax=Myceligenerans crystallogenes TaxID=316335 RepID=A0ABP4ZQW2_9MICO